MKLDEWGKLLISWVNFLDPNENITKVEELCTSGLFPRLLNTLQCKGDVTDREDNKNYYYNYLKEQYCSLEFDAQKNREAAVLHATAFLIYCSLHHPINDLQKKMIDLPHITQCQLTDFLQEFIDVPKPKITKELIFSKISGICNIGSLANSSVNTPPNFGTPVTYTSSPSAEEVLCSKSGSTKKTSRLKKMRRDIDMLTSMKVELTEELESAKEHITKLEFDIKKKDMEMSKIKSENMKREDIEHVCEIQKSNDDFKVMKLKTTIDNLEQTKCELEGSLIQLNSEKDEIYEELRKAKVLVQKSETELKLSGGIRSELEDEIGNLKSIIEQLKITNYEQSEYIAELVTRKDDSKCFSDSQSEVIFPDSLGKDIIDLQVRELQEEIENKVTEIDEMKKNIDGLNNLLQVKEEVIDVQASILKDKDMEIEQNTAKIKDLEYSALVLKSELETNEEEYQKILHQSDNEISKLKNERDSLQENVFFIQNEKVLLEENLEAKIDVIKLYEEEITVLKNTVNEKCEEIDVLNINAKEMHSKLDETLELHRQEIGVKNDQIKNLEDSISAWVARNMDLSSLVGTLTTEVNDKNLTIKNNETDLRNLECQNLFLTNTLQEKDSIINSMHTSVNCLNDDLASLKSKESSLLNDIKTSNNQITQLQSQISELQKKLEVQVSENMGLSKLVEDKDTTVQQQITKLKDMKTDFEARKRMLESELEQKEKQYKEAEEDRCRLNIDLDDLKHKFLFLELKMKEREQEVYNYCCRIESIECKLQSHIIKESVLLKNIKEFETALLKSEEELDLSRNAVSELQKEVSQLLSETEEHNKELFSLNNQIFTNTEIINDLNNKLKEAEIKYKDLQEENFKDKESSILIIEELKASLLKLNKDLIAANGVNDQHTKELTESHETLKNLENNLRTQESDLLSLKEDNFALCNDRVLKNIALDELQSNLDSCKAELNSILNEKSEMSLELEHFKEKFFVEARKVCNLEEKIFDYVSKVNSLSDEIISKNDIISNLLKDVEDLQHREIEIKCIYEGAKVELISLKEELSSINAKMNAAVKQHIDDEQTITTLQSTIDNHIHTIEQLYIEGNKFKSINENLSHEINILNTKLEIETANNKNLKDKYEEKSRLYSDSINEIEDLTHSHSSKIKCIENKYISENSKLTEEYKNLNDVLKELKDENQNICKLLENFEVNHADCETKITNAKCLILELQQKKTCLDEDILILKEKEELLINGITEKDAKISSLDSDISCLKKIISTFELEEGILNAKLQARDAEIIKLESDVKNLSIQLKCKEEEFEEDLEFKLKKIHDLDSTIGKLNSQYIQVSKEKEFLLEEIEKKKSLEVNLKTLDSEYILLKKEKIALEQEYILKKEKISELNHNLLSFEREIVDLKTSNENLLKDLQDKLNELEEAKTCIKSFEEELHESKEKESSLIKKFSRQSDIITNLEGIVASSKATLLQTKMEIDSLKVTVQERDERIASVVKENSNLKLELDLLNKKRDIMASQLDYKVNENQELHKQAERMDSEISLWSRKKTELEQTIESLYATLHSQNVEISEKNTEIEMLQKEIKDILQQLTEERKSKLSQIQMIKTEKESQEASLKSFMSEDDYRERIEQVKSTYEKKVLALKSVMKKQFTEKLEDITYTLQNENTDLKEKLLKEQGRCARLQSELWNASDKLLIAQEQNRTLHSNLQARNVYEVFRQTEPLSPMSKARSMEVLSGRNRGIDNFARDISLNESASSSRRSSIKILPTGIGKKKLFSAGKVFPTADEAGEEFDNRYLEDLKAGRCDVTFDNNRMSTLQYRNSLCPPHLKSSYPAETQFATIREDEIKAGGSSSSLGNSETDVRKVKIRSSYKKPGPPTPSRNGGRPSQDSEKSSMTPFSVKNSNTLPKDQAQEKFILREANARSEQASKPLKPSTPSRLKALFTNKKDENTPRRKSFFRRK